jgi:hypothetical protein
MRERGTGDPERTEFPVTPLEAPAMRIVRVRFSLRRLMIVVMALGFDFGVVPWPACAVVGAAMTLPLFLHPATLIEWVMIYGIAGLLAALSLPPVVTHCQRGRMAGPPPAPAAGSIPVAAPPCEGPAIMEVLEP